MMTPEDLYTEELEDNDLPVVEDEAENEANVADGDQEEAAEAEAGSSSKKAVKPKRVIRNPQPKLDHMTLRGKKGLTALESYFDRVKYKGRGHEEQDLGVILKTYEYWCHRLFPKYPFDDCIEKIEKLGSKRAVQTYIKKIRMGLESDEADALAVNDIIENDSGPEDTGNNEFDDLFNTQDLPPVHGSNDFVEDNTSQTHTVQITEEQLERIRLNKERAEKLRRERLMRRNESTRTFSQDILNENSSQISSTSENIEHNNLASARDDQFQDADSIFNKIQNLNTQEQVMETSETTHVNDTQEEQHIQLSSTSAHVESNEFSSALDNQQEDVNSIFNKIQHLNTHEQIVNCSDPVRIDNDLDGRTEDFNFQEQHHTQDSVDN